MKGAVLLFLALLLPSIVLAAPPFAVQTSTFGQLDIQYPKITAFEQGTNFTLNFHVYSINGTPITRNNASCYMHLYDERTGVHIVEQRPLTIDDDEYAFLINNTVSNRTGIYSYLVQCNQSALAIGGFVNSQFEVTRTGFATNNGENLVPVGVVIALPMLLALLLLVGAATLDGEKHAVLKTAVFLFSVVPFFASMYLGALAIARFYDFTPFGDAISEVVFYTGLVFAVLVAYFLLYVFYLVIQQIRQKKEERLRY